MPVAANKRAVIAITGDPSSLDRALKATRTKVGSFAKGVRKAFSSIAGKAGSFLARSFDPLGRAWGLIGEGIGEVQAFETRITRLQIAQGKSAEQMGAFRRSLMAASKETGIARGEVLHGMQTYQALTGDVEGAERAMLQFARVSQATGSSMDDVAGTAAALSQNLGIAVDDFERAFSVLNEQGKLGAIELKDLAQQMATITPQFSKFAGGTGVGGMAEMGAATQIVRRNFAGAAETATGLRALMTSITRNAKQLEKGGAKIFVKNPKTGKKELRDFSGIIESISKSKLMRDPTKLTKALGSAEAQRALQALVDNFAEFQSMSKAGLEGDSIAKDLKAWQESDAGRMQKAMNDLKLAIAEAFNPDVIRTFASALEGVAKFTDRMVGGIKAIADDWDEIINGKSFDKQVEEIRKRRWDERRKQLGVGGAGNRAVGFGDVASQRRRADDLLHAEDAAERSFREWAKAGTHGGLSTVASTAKAFRTDQVKTVAASLPQVLTAALMDEIAKIKAKAPAAAAARAARENTLAIAARSDRAAGALGTAGIRDLAESTGMLGSKEFGEAMARAVAAELRQMQITLTVDGDAIGKASRNARGTRRHP